MPTVSDTFNDISFKTILSVIYVAHYRWNFIASISNLFHFSRHVVVDYPRKKKFPSRFLRWFRSTNPKTNKSEKRRREDRCAYRSILLQAHPHIGSMQIQQSI